MTFLGILNLNKPAGPTSRDIVDRVERLSQPAAAGHAGTLDPLASGVLVICVGKATRLIQYVQRMPKRYRATFLLGCRSDTDDVEGDVVPVQNPPQPARAAVDTAISRFVGEIEQRPPAYSALKVRGRRAYELARRGDAIALTPRRVIVHRLEIARYEYPQLELEIECGGGTYVRALGRDLAESLGTGAVMSALERSAIGPFQVASAVPPDELTAETFAARLQPPLSAVAGLPRIEVGESQQVELRNGRPIAKPRHAFASAAESSRQADADDWAAVSPTGALVAILREKRSGQLWPVTNFL